MTVRRRSTGTVACARRMALLALLVAAASGARGDGAARAGDAAPDVIGDDGARTPALADDIASLKERIVALNRDLFLLEEALLFPSSTQVQVFVSLDVGDYFALDAVELKLDGSTVAHHLYTERELEALRRGGVQRLHLANLERGEHQLDAVFTGEGPAGRTYRRGATLAFDKALGPKYVELRIRDSQARQRPEFDIREWD
jgi:hypothetical protein